MIPKQIKAKKAMVEHHYPFFRRYKYPTETLTYEGERDCYVWRNYMGKLIHWVSRKHFELQKNDFIVVS